MNCPYFAIFFKIYLEYKKTKQTVNHALRGLSFIAVISKTHLQRNK